MLFAALALLSPLTDRVLVIENAASPTSVEVSADYRKKRGVKNLVRITCPDSALDAGKETMEYAAYQDAIEKPVKLFLKANPKIDFIVLTKGVPIRVVNAPFGLSGRASLDSALASCDYADRKDVVKMRLDDSGFKGTCYFNRFWNSTERFSHTKFGGYLVTRLDGYTAAYAKALTTASLEAEQAKPTGKILIDVAQGHGLGDVKKVPLTPMADAKTGGKTMNDMNYNDFDADLVVAGDQLTARGIPVQVDRTEDFVGKIGNLMGYASWGSNDPKFNPENYKTIRFAPGGIAETAVSTSARTFLPTTGGQSLIADLISAYVTGVKGYCDEPLLQAIASPTVLFDRYTKGWTLAESYYAASRFVGWEDIIVGDPLCAPYAAK